MSLRIDPINRPLLPSFTSQIEITAACVFLLSALIIFKALFPLRTETPATMAFMIYPSAQRGSEGAECRVWDQVEFLEGNLFNSRWTGPAEVMMYKPAV